MELDDLKYQLNQKLQPAEPLRSDGAIAALLKNKTRSVIDKIRRSLWIEIWLSLSLAVASAVIVVVAGAWPTRIYFSTFLILSLFFCCWLGILLRRIYRLSDTPLPVKNNLESIYNIVHLFARRYYQAGMLLLPLCLLFLYMLNYIDLTRKGAQPLPFSIQWPHLAALLPFLLLFAFVVYVLLKWYTRKMFGRYLEQLKEYIGELENSF